MVVFKNFDAGCILNGVFPDLQSHLLFQNAGRCRCIGHLQQNIFLVFLFQFLHRFLFQQNTMVQNADIIGQHGNFRKDMA